MINKLVVEEKEEEIEWRSIYFDGAINMFDNRVGVMIIDLEESFFNQVIVWLHEQYCWI
jgi:hypothetical protein